MSNAVQDKTIALAAQLALAEKHFAAASNLLTDAEAHRELLHQECARCYQRLTDAKRELLAYVKEQA